MSNRQVTSVQMLTSSLVSSDCSCRAAGPPSGSSWTDSLDFQMWPLCWCFDSLELRILSRLLWWNKLFGIPDWGHWIWTFSPFFFCTRSAALLGSANRTPCACRPANSPIFPLSESVWDGSVHIHRPRLKQIPGEKGETQRLVGGLICYRSAPLILITMTCIHQRGNWAQPGSLMNLPSQKTRWGNGRQRGRSEEFCS